MDYERREFLWWYCINNTEFSGIAGVTGGGFIFAKTAFDGINKIKQFYKPEKIKKKDIHIAVICSPEALENKGMYLDMYYESNLIAPLKWIDEQEKNAYSR